MQGVRDVKRSLEIEVEGRLPCRGFAGAEGADLPMASAATGWPIDVAMLFL